MRDDNFSSNLESPTLMEKRFFDRNEKGEVDGDEDEKYPRN